MIESYAGKTHECYPSYKTIADATCLSVRTVVKVVNQLVSLGWLQRTNQVDKNGQKSNLYKVTVWHLANVPIPSRGTVGKLFTPYEENTPDASNEPLGKSYTHAPNAIPPMQNMHPPYAPDAHELDINKLDNNNIVNKAVNKKKRNQYPMEFEIFFDRYKKIEKRASEQSKKSAYDEYKKAVEAARII